MSARTANGWRWAKGTMKVLGVVIAVWIIASYRTNPPIKLLLGLVVLLVFAALVLGIAFALGWAVGGEPISRRSSTAANIGYALLGLAGLLLPLGLFIGGVAAFPYSLWALLPMIMGGAGLVWMLIATRK